MNDVAKYCAVAKDCAAYVALKTAFARGRNSHAYQFDSQDVLLGKCVAAMLACDDADARPGDPKRARILGGKCVDVKFLGEGGFTAETADEVVAGCLVTPVELERKYYVLDLTKTNESAQNKLLKTLEDSPECAVFFVLAPGEAALLPTVVSRCERLTPFLPAGSVNKLDGGLSPYLDCALYGGSESLTEFDGLLSGAKSGYLLAAVKIVRAAGAGKLLAAASAFPSKRDEAAETLKYIERILGDIMKAGCGLAVDTRGLYDMKELTEAFPVGCIPSALAAVRRAVKRAVSGNMTSIADELIITLAEVNAKCRKL